MKTYRGTRWEPVWVGYLMEVEADNEAEAIAAITTYNTEDYPSLRMVWGRGAELGETIDDEGIEEYCDEVDEVTE